MTQEEMGRITFRIGPRELKGAKCQTCGKVATYLLARPYDLAPGGEVASTSCAECAAGFPLWKAGGVGRSLVPAAHVRDTPPKQSPDVQAALDGLASTGVHVNTRGCEPMRAETVEALGEVVKAAQSMAVRHTLPEVTEEDVAYLRNEIESWRAGTSSLVVRHRGVLTRVLAVLEWVQALQLKGRTQREDVAPEKARGCPTKVNESSDDSADEN